MQVILDRSSLYSVVLLGSDQIADDELQSLLLIPGPKSLTVLKGVLLGRSIRTNTLISIGISGSAAGFLYFFFLKTFVVEGGTGEEAVGLIGLLNSAVSGAGSGAARVDSRVAGAGSRGFS